MRPVDLGGESYRYEGDHGAYDAGPDRQQEQVRMIGTTLAVRTGEHNCATSPGCVARNMGVQHEPDCGWEPLVALGPVAEYVPCPSRCQGGEVVTAGDPHAMYPAVINGQRTLRPGDPSGVDVETAPCRTCGGMIRVPPVVARYWRAEWRGQADPLDENVALSWLAAVS